MFPWRCFNSNPGEYMDQYSFSYNRFSVRNGTPEDILSVSTPWCEGGWVQYPQGKYWNRFWLPTHWRAEGCDAYWLNGVTTLRLEICYTLAAIIKFHLESSLSLECAEHLSIVEPTSASPY